MESGSENWIHLEEKVDLADLILPNYNETVLVIYSKIGSEEATDNQPEVGSSKETFSRTIDNKKVPKIQNVNHKIAIKSQT